MKAAEVDRCSWCLSSEIYMNYHDTEWGRPVVDDLQLFEKVCLEGFQSGLSWITILRKREKFRELFCHFNPDEIAQFGKREVEALVLDPGIIRHRGKIEATIHNARRYLEMRAAGETLRDVVWQYAEPPADPDMPHSGEVFAQTPQSLALSKDLKKRGWKFVGPTTMYAFMQSMGLVNDHATTCYVRAECERQRATVHLPPTTRGGAVR